MVITPTAATTTQKRGTSALWRRTKRVRAGIVTSHAGEAAAGAPRAWGGRGPVTVLAVSAAAVTASSLLGFVNGAVLVAPILALYAVATQVSVLRAAIAAVATLAVLMTATAANNPFGRISGGGFDIIPFMVAAAPLAGIPVANRRAHLDSIPSRAE